VDRGALQRILLDSLPKGTIQWGCKVTAVHPLGDGRHELTFGELRTGSPSSCEKPVAGRGGLVHVYGTKVSGSFRIRLSSSPTLSTRARQSSSRTQSDRRYGSQRHRFLESWSPGRNGGTCPDGG
jgi:hypothetical protein